MTQKLTEALKNQKKSTTRKQLQIVGTLGISLGGQKLTEVPGRKSFVYVKLRDNPNEVIQAFNNKVAASYGLPVIVERRHSRYMVLDVDTIRYQNNWNSFAPFLPIHGNTHSFDPENGGGGDVVWIHSRQLMPSLIIPSGSLGGPNVLMSSYTLQNPDRTWKYTGNTGTPNLTPFKPHSTGTTLALVYLDVTTGNPGFIFATGTYLSPSITGTAQLVPYFPVLTSPESRIPLSVVRLVSGTSSIGWDNIYDVRQWIHPIVTGTSGGSALNIQDEGTPLGTATTLNVVGTVADISVAGGIARLFITGSFSSTGTSIGEPNKVVGTDENGRLNALPWLFWNYDQFSGNGYLKFGYNITGQEANAGVMGYNVFTEGFFDIVGAGTSVPNRWIRMFDNLKVNSHFQTNGFQNLGLVSHFVYLNATGTFVSPSNAPLESPITGTYSVLGLNTVPQSIRFTVSTLASALYTVDVVGTFLSNTTVTASTTFSACPWKNIPDTSTNSVPWPEGGIATNLLFRKGPSAQPASGSLVVTLYINNAATALTITVPAGTGAAAASFEDTTHEVIIAAGDRVEWRFQNNATAASAQMTSVTMKLRKPSVA